VPEAPPPPPGRSFAKIVYEMLKSALSPERKRVAAHAWRAAREQPLHAAHDWHTAVKLTPSAAARRRLQPRAAVYLLSHAPPSAVATRCRLNVRARA